MDAFNEATETECSSKHEVERSCHVVAPVALSFSSFHVSKNGAAHMSWCRNVRRR
jgi:hypothetical protein